jgi:hypothetical protein
MMLPVEQRFLFLPRGQRNLPTNFPSTRPELGTSRGDREWRPEVLVQCADGQGEPIRWSVGADGDKPRAASKPGDPMGTADGVSEPGDPASDDQYRLPMQSVMGFLQQTVLHH